MTASRVRVEDILVGKAIPFGPKGEKSAMHKVPLDGPATIEPTGFAKDEQADLSVHGGLEKAIHHYPYDHYPVWQAESPVFAPRLSQRGAFGENISTTGWTEDDVCIGDVFALGSARLEISQGRQPCWKLNVRFNDKKMVERVLRSGRTGWYYRVRQTGVCQTGDVLTLLDRTCPDWTVAKVKRVLFDAEFQPEPLSVLASLPLLAEPWREKAATRLSSMR